MPDRVRRSREDARRVILDAAAALLAESGAAGVQVRAVAARVGMTDAGVAHHFVNRETLLRELLRHGGRQLRNAVDQVVRSWIDRDADLEQLVLSLSDVYRRGYGELAVALHAAGWRDRGSGLLDPLAVALHARRAGGQGTLEDTRLAVAALHQAVATESLYGAAFRRSAGIAGADATDPSAQLSWWARQLETALGLPQGGRSDLR